MVANRTRAPPEVSPYGPPRPPRTTTEAPLPFFTLPRRPGLPNYSQPVHTKTIATPRRDAILDTPADVAHYNEAIVAILHRGLSAHESVSAACPPRLSAERPKVGRRKRKRDHALRQLQMEVNALNKALKQIELRAWPLKVGRLACDQEAARLTRVIEQARTGETPRQETEPMWAQLEAQVRSTLHRKIGLKCLEETNLRLTALHKERARNGESGRQGRRWP